jgi:hypothetical protein
MSDVTYKVEYMISVPSFARWRDSSDYGFKMIDPGIDLPYVYVPRDAVITEVKPPIEDGLYMHRTGVLYKKSAAKWFHWNTVIQEWQETNVVSLSNEHGFATVLVRVDA